jgi:ABC-type Fe3+-hydroxamate transport system substrate-binding protein
MIILTCIISAFGLVLSICVISKADAHFLGGTTSDADGYQVTFAPSPETPVAGNNSTT